MVRPGITGLAQVNEIDMSTPELLAKTDREMIDTLTLGSYFKYPKSPDRNLLLTAAMKNDDSWISFSAATQIIRTIFRPIMR